MQNPNAGVEAWSTAHIRPKLGQLSINKEWQISITLSALQLTREILVYEPKRHQKCNDDVELCTQLCNQLILSSKFSSLTI